MKADCTEWRQHPIHPVSFCQLNKITLIQVKIGTGVIISYYPLTA